ncbi:MAG: ectonucleotide pyrophosphatase/phosphodiesterase [Treponema sp.]|nr:ectonucleotide pyrophosphatase/phosphodiesterase [Treponema sp.]
MKKGAAKLIIISFDAAGDRVFDRLAALPATGALFRSAAVVRKVRSVFLTNTYPVHASVVSGVHPAEHGLFSNEPPFPAHYPVWNFRASGIRAKTLWQAAAEKGLTAASVLWPVTGGAREIRWNLPEIMPRPGDNQILLNLKNGTKFTQLRLWLKYRRLLEGISQPARDRFAAACMADILRRHKPDLALMHFTCYDTLCHHHGEDWTVLEKALRVMDEGLSRLLEAAGGEGDEKPAVIVFSDHAQLPLQQSILPNDILAEMGLLDKDEGGEYRMTGAGCFFECAGGSAFFHPGAALLAACLGEIRARVEKSPGFNRYLTPEEMRLSGRGELPFGFCALPGYDYAVYNKGEKGQHGYPADYKDYEVFYAVRGRGVKTGAVFEGGSLLDLAPIALRLLGDGLPENRKPVIPRLPPARDELFNVGERKEEHI